MNKPSAYDILQNEIGYFDAPRKSRVQASAPVAAVKKLCYNNMPQPVTTLVARLHADIAKVDSMTDAFGKEIKQAAIIKLSAFLTANKVAF